MRESPAEAPIPARTAISGGVSTDDYTKTVPVGQSFPGRMDWSANAPKSGRLDGWVVQFASQTGSAPEKVKVVSDRSH